MKNLYKLAVSYCLKFLLIVFIFTGTAASAQESMRANLYAVTGGQLLLIDGNLTDYGKSYSNDVDIHDAWKLSNPGINFGIMRSDIDLVIERRKQYRKTDTTFFRMWNMPKSDYCFKFILQELDHPGMQGFLVDKYLNTRTPVKLNDTTLYNFKVNTESASADEMRFQLIYAPDPVLASMDILFVEVNARREAGDILVDWTVENEMFVDYYNVEYSADGNNFNEVQYVISDNSETAKSYSFTDSREKGKKNYYRIKAVGMTGQIAYSKKLKLDESNTNMDVNIFPNPITDRKLRMSVNNLPVGKYSLSLVNVQGVQFRLNDVQIAGTETEIYVNIPGALSPGIYRLVINRANNIRIIKTISLL